MPALTVDCPHCGKILKMRDESYIGKKIRCPGCQNPVVLNPGSEEEAEDDEEVQIELVNPITPVPQSRPLPTPPPESVRPSARPSAPAVFPQAPRPVNSPFGIVEESDKPAAESGSAAEHLRRMIEQKKRRSKMNAVLVVGVLGIAGIGGAIAIPLLNNSKMPVAVAPPVTTTETPSGARAAVPTAVGAVSEEQFERRPDLLAEFRPTNGKPIDLKMVPDGVNLLIHLHPARLWANDEAMTELRSCLTEPVVKWVEAKIQQLCRRTPDQIEELVVAIVLGPTGSTPQFATVVHLAAPAKPSDLIEEFRGQVITDDGTTRLVTRDDAYFVVSGLKTFATGPIAAASEIQAALTMANETVPDGILELVRQSDRDRLFTIVFEVDDIRRNVETLFAPIAVKAVNNVLDWFGEDIATVAWAADLGTLFHSEFTMYPKGTRAGGGVLATPRLVRDTLKQQLPDMPLLVMEAVKKMNPGTVGFRTIIGRFPAMMEAFALQTVATTTPKTARLTTVLPAKAASNLALGTLLTWDESTRTNFTSAPTVEVADAGPKLPDKIEDRLRLPIDTDITMPLEQAFAYLLGEVRVEVFVDGNALKSSGITKNEVQKPNLGKAPVFKAIQAILNRSDRLQTYPDIVFVLDDAAKKVTITTKADAAAKGMTVFDIRGMK